jgi:hypothetical protein
MIVPADGTRVQSTAVLRRGEAYGFTITGTVTLAYGAGVEEDVDALYCFANRGGPPGGSCSTTPPGPALVSPLFLDVGGGPTTTPSGLAGSSFDYNPDHLYERSFVAPSDGALGARLRAFGSPPAPGTGGFAIELYGRAPAAQAPAPAVPPGSLPGRPPIIGPPLFRIVDIHPAARARSKFDSVVDGGRPLKPRVGWLLGAGDAITVIGGSIASGGIRLQALSGGATFEVTGSIVYQHQREPIETSDWFVAGAAPTLRQGEVTVSTGGARTQARTTGTGGQRTRERVRDAHQPGAPGASAGARPAGGGHAERDQPAVRPRAGPPDRDPEPPQRAGRAGGRHGALQALAAVAEAVEVRGRLGVERARRPGPGDDPQRPAQRAPLRAAPRGVHRRGPQGTCIKVPARAKTFDVRTPLSFAVGYALGARARPGQRPTRPVIRPITLVP